MLIHQPVTAQTLPTNDDLDATRAYLWNAPITDHHSPERYARLAVVQAAIDQVSPALYKEYMDAAVHNPQRADELEANGGLYFLATSVNNAIRDIAATRVQRGVAIWAIYNMGYVVKTPDACFGIDLCIRDGQRLVPYLDFLLVTHGHGDHSTPELLDAMLAAKKPVITRWYPGTTVITQATELDFGSIHIKIDIGDHHFEQAGQTDNMLMYQITCGGTADGFTIYHSGDGNNYQKMHPDRPVDLFIYHVSVGLNSTEAVRVVNPHTIFVSHLLELGHSPTPPNAWRWSFKRGLSAAKSFPAREAFVFSWGERWLAPGTVLAPVE